MFISRRSEQKIWSPLVSEEGKRHPYKMNLASEPQVSAYLCPSSASCFPAWALFGESLVFPALEVWGSSGRESLPLSLLGSGSSSVLPVRELREERTGKPQGRGLAWPGLEARSGKTGNERRGQSHSARGVGRTLAGLVGR